MVRVEHRNEIQKMVKNKNEINLYVEWQKMNVGHFWGWSDNVNMKTWDKALGQQASTQNHDAQFRTNKALEQALAFYNQNIGNIQTIPKGHRRETLLYLHLHRKELLTQIETYKVVLGKHTQPQTNAQRVVSLV